SQYAPRRPHGATPRRGLRGVLVDGSSVDPRIRGGLAPCYTAAYPAGNRPHPAVTPMRPVLLLAAVLAAVASAEPPTNAPTADARPADPKAARIVLVAGSNFYKSGEHEYVGGCAVLADLLRQTPGVAPVIALDWPKKPETLAGARAVVFFFDGAEKHE